MKSCNPVDPTGKQHSSSQAQDHGVYLRPQFWFKQLLLNRYQDHLWSEHFTLKVWFCKLKHEASVWQIILPDYLAGICYYTQPDCLQHLSGQSF